MPVKRSLKLDDPVEANPFDPSKITVKKSITDYSPTTGTCQRSPFASPMSSEEQEHRTGPSNGIGKRKKSNQISLTKRKKSTTKDNELMALLSEAEKSSEEIMGMMQSLSVMQALESNRKLENLIGAPCGLHFLKREMQRTKELMAKVTQELSEKKSSELPTKELRHLDSYEFLTAILN